MSCRVKLAPSIKRLPSPSVIPVRSGWLQRKCACQNSTDLKTQYPDCRNKRQRLTLQRKGTRAHSPENAFRVLADVVRSQGQQLDPITRDHMERRFGHDFSKVRIHADSKAAQSAKGVNALAFTVGQNVVFGEGQYAPGKENGRLLLAHELAHVAQQSRGSGIQSEIIEEYYNPDTEREAETAARSIGRGENYNILHSVPQSIARQGEEAEPGPPPGAPGGSREEIIESYTLSDEGFQFLLRHEGIVTHLYNDSAGHCTIGVGHLVHLGRCDGRSSESEFKNGITEDQATDMFREDLGRIEDAVSANVKKLITQYQYDALVSFTFNVGTGAFQRSTLLRELNSGHYSRVPREMMKFLRPPELRSRRTDEANLFRLGTYE